MTQEARTHREAYTRVDSTLVHLFAQAVCNGAAEIDTPLGPVTVLAQPITYLLAGAPVSRRVLVEQLIQGGAL